MADRRERAVADKAAEVTFQAFPNGRPHNILLVFCWKSDDTPWSRGTVGGVASTGEQFMPTIALVDDDRNILTSVSMTLESEGYRVQTFTDGVTALDGLAQQPPDLASLDIKMPRMDCIELLRKLR